MNEFVDGLVNGDQSWSMVKNTADVVHSHFAKVSISAFFVEQRRVAVEDRLVNVHTASVVAEKRLRHECCDFAILASNVVDDIFVFHKVIGCFRKCVKTEVDFSLSSCCNFMVMTLNAKAGFLHQTNHFAADILLGINWSYRNIAAFNADFEAKVAAFFFAAVFQAASSESTK